MINKNILGLIFVLFFSSYGNAECIASDLVLRNGTVYTGDINQPLAKTIAIKDEFIVYVGSDELTNESFCGNPRTLDLTGRYIFPGFVDAHGHLKGIGYRELTLNLQGINSLKETMDTVESYVLNQDSGDWVIGRGWIDKV